MEQQGGTMQIRGMLSDDVFDASRLLVNVFNEDEDINPLSRALIIAEHVIGLRGRYSKNVILVCRRSPGHEIIGFIEMYTPDYLATQAEENVGALQKDVTKRLQPYIANLAV